MFHTLCGPHSSFTFCIVIQLFLDRVSCRYTVRTKLHLINPHSSGLMCFTLSHVLVNNSTTFCSVCKSLSRHFTISALLLFSYLNSINLLISLLNLFFLVYISILQFRQTPLILLTIYFIYLERHIDISLFSFLLCGMILHFVQKTTKSVAYCPYLFARYRNISFLVFVLSQMY